jgi:hypothetical protein
MIHRMGLYFFLFGCGSRIGIARRKILLSQSIRGIHDKEVNRVRIPMSGEKSARALQDGKTGHSITFPQACMMTGKGTEYLPYPGEASFSEVTGICRFLPGNFP